MDLKTIKIIWMDDREGVYRSVTASVLNGVLHVHQYTGDRTHRLTDQWHFPIDNIREWKPVTNED